MGNVYCLEPYIILLILIYVVGFFDKKCNINLTDELHVIF